VLLVMAFWMRLKSAPILAEAVMTPWQTAQLLAYNAVPVVVTARAPQFRIAVFIADSFHSVSCFNSVPVSLQD
jgi:hypothetical protein